MPKCPHCHLHIDSPRTQNQNSALWLFLTHLANALNDAGLDMRVVLKPSYNLRWSKNTVHDHLWLPIQKAMFGTKSTKDLKKIGEIEQIHETIMRELGEKYGLEYIPFPNEPDIAPMK